MFDGCSRHLNKVDPEIADIINRELERQSTQLELIASENYTSRAVLEAESSVLTNKYAEGLPGQRCYHGCKHVDSAEQLAIDRAKEVFGSDHANVQPHSGNQANMATYCALLDPGDTVMSMSLTHGGHLSHGSPANFSGVQYRIVSYVVDRASETIDYDQAELLAREHKPRLIIAGSSSYPRVIDFDRFRAIADAVGAYLMVDMAHIAGLVAAGVHPSPVPASDVVTTTTHKTLRGPTGGMILCRQEHANAIDRMVFPGIQGGPLMHTIAAKAVALKEATIPEFRAYQQAVVANARALANELGQRGFRVVSGGTDTHIVLLDLASRGLLGQQAADALEAADIVVSKSPVPFGDKRLSWWSGIRLGTPKLTTRGMDTQAMVEVASLIERVLTDPEDESEQGSVRDGVRQLCERFPLPYDR